MELKTEVEAVNVTGKVLKVQMPGQAVEETTSACWPPVLPPDRVIVHTPGVDGVLVTGGGVVVGGGVLPTTF